MKRIMLLTTAGTVSELMPGPMLPGETDEEHTERIVARTLDAAPEGSILHGATVICVCDHAELPDRTFFNAFCVNAGRIGVDLTKAKGIAHTKRRRDRAAAFKPLDIEATIPAKAEQAEAQRQAIRDADAARQIAIDAATDIATLKALM